MRKSAFLITIAVMLLAVSGSLLVSSDATQYSALDKAFYLSAEDGIWIRPGLNIEIQNVSIGSDRKPVVTIRLTDDGGQPLDRSGNLTPGAVSLSWLIAYLPADGDQYVNYNTRSVTSSISNMTATQATTDSGGSYVSNGDGVYTYTFGRTLPSDYDQTATHTIGIYSSRNLTEFGLSTYVANALENFVPNGAQVTKVREVVATANCNQCHNPLALHGGSRRETGLCILCHQPQSTDPDTGNTVDFKVMIHKIHRGEDLPSVADGKPYQIIGFNNSVHDYSTVAFPRDIRSCETCHKNASQAGNWKLKPSRATCGSCHDDVDFTTGANHPGGPQANDSRCASCHYPDGDYEWDASISGAHTVPDKSTQLAKPQANIISISNTGPGQKPTVRFTINDKNGNFIPPSGMSRLSLRLAGPTSDYNWYRSESALAATVGADSINSYTFTGALPNDAKGTYSIGIEGRISTSLHSIALGTFNYNDGMPNVVKYFAVTGTTVTPRRQVVDVAKCNNCHERLQVHGNNRNNPEYCVGCHNPTLTATVVAGEPNDSVHFKYMIHKLHTGEELENGYRIGNAIFSELRFPGDRRDCSTCHVGNTYTLPLPSGLLSTDTPRNYWTPTAPVAAACLACHDTIEAAAHAIINTASFGESCNVCHKEGADFAVSKVHAR
jgi:OmcA/MtrC family decaheme c-type cytochrome